MSKMAELDYDIEQLFIEGLSAKQIARELNCPVELVAGWIASNGCKEFPEWTEEAQSRLINDIFEEDCSPYATLNS